MVRVIVSATPQRDDSQKKRDEKTTLNYRLLFKEFDAIGLPDVMNKNPLYELSTPNGKDRMLGFDKQVGGLLVKGRLYLEASDLNDMYTISYFELILEGLADVRSRRNTFLCAPICFITLEEAVNLTQGRCIYRESEVDPFGKGCWLFLGSSELMPGVLQPLILHNGFRVREYLLETGLGSWLGLEGYNKLVSDLENGYRCDLTLGTGKGMRTVKVEADPFQQRLKVMDGEEARN